MKNINDLQNFYLLNSRFTENSIVGKASSHSVSEDGDAHVTGVEMFVLTVIVERFA